MASGVRVRIEMDEVTDMLRRLSEAQVVDASAAGVRDGLQWMLRDVIVSRLSGQYLNVITGAARKSMRTQMEIKGNKIVGTLGSPLNYVRAHERGFKGIVTVPAHQVREHSRRGVTISAHTRRTHTRRMNLRARHFIGDSVRAGLPKVRERIAFHLAQLAKPGGAGA